MVNSVKVRKILSKRCMGYLVHVTSKINESVLNLQSTSNVCKFLDVFSNDLPRLAPKKEVKFSIELALRIMLIFKALHRIVPIELHKLKTQL